MVLWANSFFSLFFFFILEQSPLELKLNISYKTTLKFFFFWFLNFVVALFIGFLFFIQQDNVFFSDFIDFVWYLDVDLFIIIVWYISFYELFYLN